MKRSRLVEMDYFEFKRQLKTAADAGRRIEKTDKEKWSAYIRQHGIMEAGSEAIARSQTGATDITSVVLEGEGAWDGFFIYSKDAVTCYKFILEEVGT
ncbi:MAG: hypothetical protein R3E12_01210 [Candidatus Eisenbacteria bacterium]